jgi:NADH-quinone oxidoreductase subunit D
MSTELFGSDLSTWGIGPYHAMLPGPMRVSLRLDGEIIVAADVETGFLHRGIEKALELQPWQASVLYAGRLDPEGAVFGELALCLAVEEIGGIEVPPRAQSIRVILSELGRISSHMVFVARMAKTVGAETIIHYVLRDRERVLDLFELLTGARFSYNFIRFGGVKDDVTDGFIERVVEVCELIRSRLKEYNDLFTYNHAVLRRTRGVGSIIASRVRDVGMTGPNARASGVRFDVRKSHPYCGYERLDFDLIANEEAEGDAHGRFLVRLHEISQSVGILKQAVEAIPVGAFSARRVDESFHVPAGEAYSRVEGARGFLGCHAVSDGSLRPARVQFRPPSLAHLQVVPELAVGLRIEDLAVLLASLDPGVAEADG